MKHLFIYCILFSLAFLNVPRSLVHDCDHHASENTTDATVTIDQDDCFVCEFQLDFFEVPSFHLPVFKHYTPVVAPIQNTQLAATEFYAHYTLRGPPAIV